MSFHPRDLYFDLNGLRLHALMHGRAENPPLLLLHGFLDQAGAWNDCAAMLAGRFHVAALDFRGFGDSAWSPGGHYQFSEYFLDLAALYRALGLSRAALAGHSMGGNVAGLWAGLFPDRVSRLVLVEGFGPPGHDPSELPQRTQAWVEGLLAKTRTHPRVMKSLTDVAERLQETHARLGDEAALRLAATAVKPVDGGFVWKFDPSHRLPSPHPYREDEAIEFWKRVEAPTLALFGSEGGVSPDMMQGRYGHFKDLSEQIIEGTGHGIHVEKPGELAAAITGFL